MNEMTKAPATTYMIRAKFADNIEVYLDVTGVHQIGVGKVGIDVTMPHYCDSPVAEETRSLLRKPIKHISELGPCHCPPGICQAPVIMGQRAYCPRVAAPAEQPTGKPDSGEMT